LIAVDTNILVGIVPEVSSTYGIHSRGKEYLTDGIKTAISGGSGYWHSQFVGSQWAKIVFQKHSTITQVRVTNRCGCSYRLTGAKVFIGQSHDNAETQCGRDIPSTEGCADAVLVCGEGMSGDYVVIRHINNSSLNIVEIEAYGNTRTCFFHSSCMPLYLMLP